MTPRILIVEDEPDIALGLELDLRDEGYEVEVVGDGETAIARGGAPPSSCGRFGSTSTMPRAAPRNVSPSTCSR